MAESLNPRPAPCCELFRRGVHSPDCTAPRKAGEGAWVRIDVGPNRKQRRAAAKGKR